MIYKAIIKSTLVQWEPSDKNINFELDDVVVYGVNKDIICEVSSIFNEHYSNLDWYLSKNLYGSKFRKIYERPEVVVTETTEEEATDYLIRNGDIHTWIIDLKKTKKHLKIYKKQLKYKAFKPKYNSKLPKTLSAKTLTKFFNTISVGDLTNHYYDYWK